METATCSLLKSGSYRHWLPAAVFTSDRRIHFSAIRFGTQRQLVTAETQSGLHHALHI